MQKWLLHGRVYVDDEGTITCGESECKCATGRIHFNARRMTLAELICELERHWSENE